jgi:hypothetical protein
MLAWVLTSHLAVGPGANAPCFALCRVSHRDFRLFRQGSYTLRKLDSKNNSLILGYNRVDTLE